MKTADKKRRRDVMARGRRFVVLAALAAGATRAAAAAKAGISKRTLDRWTSVPGFTSELEAARQKAFFDALAALRGGADHAARRLLDLLDSEDERERRLAAVEILGFAMKSHETGELEARISALEALAHELSPHPRIGPN